MRKVIEKMNIDFEKPVEEKAIGYVNSLVELSQKHPEAIERAGLTTSNSENSFYNGLPGMDTSFVDKLVEVGKYVQSVSMQPVIQEASKTM